MTKTIKIGVLAFQGDVIEHIETTEKALHKLKLKGEVVAVRTAKDLDGLAGLIIPGGESTVLYTLCERAGMIEKMKRYGIFLAPAPEQYSSRGAWNITLPGKKRLGLWI